MVLCATVWLRADRPLGMVAPAPQTTGQVQGGHSVTAIGTGIQILTADTRRSNRANSQPQAYGA